MKYTRMVLRQSLLELLADMPVSKVTTAELCRRADVNRNTFYSHYSSPEDLLRSVEEELFVEVEAAIERSLKFESIPDLIEEICQVILDNLDLCRIILSGNADSRFLDRVIYLAHDRSVEEWKKARSNLDGTQMERLYTFFAKGCVAVIESWIQDGARESPRELAQFISRISNRGLSSFMRKT